MSLTGKTLGALVLCLGAGCFSVESFAQSLPSDYSSIVGSSGQSQGFKSLNAPSVLSFDSSTNTYKVGMSFSGGYSYVKFFMPPGVVYWTASELTYKDYRPGQIVMRWQTPPTTSPSQVTKDMAFASSNAGGVLGGAFDETVLKNVQAGKEVFFYGAPEAGVISVSYGGVFVNPAPVQGGYLYSNYSYPGGVVIKSQWNFLVDKSCYDSWYANAQWDVDGNPLESATHTCAGSTGGVTLTGIALNPSFLQYTLGAQQQQSVQVTAVPPNAPLTDCKFSATSINASITPRGAVSLLDGARQLTQDEKLTVSCGQVTADLTIKAVSSATVSLESISVANNLQPNATLSTLIRPNPISASLGKCSVFPESYVTVQDNSITLNAAANQITSDQDVEVACSGKKVTFKILKPVEELTKVQVVESSDSSGNLSLLLSMTRSPVVLSTVKPVDVWIAAKVTASFGINETWYFLVGSPSVSWSPFNAGANDFAFLLSEWGRVTYKGSGDLKTDTQIQTLTVGLGFKKEQLLTAGVELWVAEQVEGRGRVMLGKVWPK